MICGNCKGQIEDGAKLCPLCHVAPSVKWAKPDPNAVTKGRGPNLSSWVVSAVVLGALIYGYLHKDRIAAFTETGRAKVDAMIRGSSAAQDAAAKAAAQSGALNDQLREMGELPAGQPAPAAAADDGLGPPAPEAPAPQPAVVDALELLKDPPPAPKR